MLKIKTIFPTIQGEGSWTGTPAVFIRFAECNLSCKFSETDLCDTNFAGGEKMDIGSIIKEVKKYPTKYVVITGGEPTIQKEGLYRLASELRQLDYKVGLETNGTNEIDINYFDHVTISPKDQVNMENQSQEKNRTLKQFECHDLKVVYTGQSLWELEEYSDKFKVHKSLWLQPLSNKPESVQETIKAVMQWPNWRLSLQTHKMVGLA